MRESTCHATFLSPGHHVAVVLDFFALEGEADVGFVEPRLDVHYFLALVVAGGNLGIIWTETDTQC